MPRGRPRLPDHLRKPAKQDKAKHDITNKKWLENPENREKARLARKRWGELNKEREREYDRNRQGKGQRGRVGIDPEKRREYQRKWREQNREKYRALKANAHARRKARMSDIVTEHQLKARLSNIGKQCVYCDGPYEHIDHVVPLANGGRNIVTNLVPACERCNSSKQARDWVEWYRKQSFFCPDRFSFILSIIPYDYIRGMND